jgi:hypothetical protein
MNTDRQVLRQLNREIGDLENKGKRRRLAAIIAPRLAFQRADSAQTIEDRTSYLRKVKAGGTRATRAIEVYGNRAIVRCVVAVGRDRFHNIRLFVRRKGRWQLLGWANEPV